MILDGGLGFKLSQPKKRNCKKIYRRFAGEVWSLVKKTYISAPRSLANKKLTLIKMMHLAVARLDAGLRFDVSQLRKKINGKNFLKNYQIFPEKPNLG